MRKLALICMGITGKLITLYLTISHFRHTETICPATGISGCAIASSSVYAQLGPAPVALIGFVAWVTLLFFSIQYYRSRKNIWPVVAISSFGVAAAGYYNAIMLFKLQSICMWCELSHALMISVFFVSASIMFGDRSKWLLKTSAVAIALILVPFTIGLLA